MVITVLTMKYINFSWKLPDLIIHNYVIITPLEMLLTIEFSWGNSPNSSIIRELYSLACRCRKWYTKFPDWAEGIRKNKNIFNSNTILWKIGLLLSLLNEFFNKFLLFPNQRKSWFIREEGEQTKILVKCAKQLP